MCLQIGEDFLAPREIPIAETWNIPDWIGLCLDYGRHEIHTCTGILTAIASGTCVLPDLGVAIVSRKSWHACDIGRWCGDTRYWDPFVSTRPQNSITSRKAGWIRVLGLRNSVGKSRPY